MSDINLVIKIPENIVEDAKSSPNYYPTYHFKEIWRAIANGTPLSEELKTIKAETIIDELEKIKAEITEYRRKNNCGVMECLDIIDKDIKTARRSRWRK